MSSVLKAYRKPSDFDVIDKAIELEDKVIDYIYNDFVENTKLDEVSLQFIYDERKAITDFCRNMRVCLDMANTTYMFSVQDYYYRKSMQGRAISWCSTLRQELQKIIKKLNRYINVNKYKDINTQINNSNNLFYSLFRKEIYGNYCIN